MNNTQIVLALLTIMENQEQLAAAIAMTASDVESVQRAGNYATSIVHNNADLKKQLRKNLEETDNRYTYHLP